MPIVQLSIPADRIQGFNYHPSYASCAFETWRHFDAEVFQRELGKGKEYFPKMNAVRLWLSWDAFTKNPSKFIDAVRTALDICDKLNLKAILVLFNRWHEGVNDCGGIYIDHFLPKASWIQNSSSGARPPTDAYVQAMADAFKNDGRILGWDLCNEPFAIIEGCEWLELIEKYELEWLKNVAFILRQGGITQPVGIGSFNHWHDEKIKDLVDCFFTHLYFWFDASKHVETITQADKDNFQKKIDLLLAIPKAVGKPVVVTETFWGSFSDEFRIQNVAATLELFRKNHIGFLGYSLYESDIADIHRPEIGALNPTIGHLEFIYKDGTLRPGHDIVNQYMQ